jgi:hypothetical protein
VEEIFLWVIIKTLNKLIKLLMKMDSYILEIWAELLKKEFFLSQEESNNLL